jgi:hypothetical protein
MKFYVLRLVDWLPNAVKVKLGKHDALLCLVLIEAPFFFLLHYL